MDFPFYDAPNTATIVCYHVMNKESPILYVSHDADDGMWQFLCGRSHDETEARIVSLKFVFEIDNSVGELRDMPCGYYATRESKEHPWAIKKK